MTRNFYCLLSLRSQCAHWLWQSVIPCAAPFAPANASGGVLPASSGRKYPKNAAKTHGSGILSAAEAPTVSASFCPANWFVQNLCRPFVSSLRPHPRRTLRLCWPGETGKTSASTVRRREGTPPYKNIACRRVGWTGSSTPAEIWAMPMRSASTKKYGGSAPHKNRVISPGYFSGFYTKMKFETP